VKDFHNLNRSTNPSDWGTFGDFFGGILNPILAFCTLIVTIIIAFELKKIEDKNNAKTISATYQPQLVIEQVKFQTYTNNENPFNKPVEFSREAKGMDYNSAQHSINPFFLEVFNIGLGSAKDIEFTI
jgi:hypothetical protein